MSMYQTFMVLLIFCFTTGFGLEEYGCKFDENYKVQQHNSEPVWGKLINPKLLELNKSAYDDLIKKIADAKEKVLDQYIYDETKVTTLFSEYEKILSKENKSFNKASWTQFLTDHSFKMDSRQDNLGITNKIFKELFNSLKGSKNLNPELVKKASYFAAVTRLNTEDFWDEIHDSIGLIAMRYEISFHYIFIHPFMDNVPVYDYSINKHSDDPDYTFLLDPIKIHQSGSKLEFHYNHTKYIDTIRIAMPLCSITYTANLKINNYPLIIYGKYTKLGGFDSYILTSVDGTGLKDPLSFYCKEMSKEKKFCIGYVDIHLEKVEKTFGSVKEMTEDDERVLRNVANKMNNTFHPVTYDYLMGKLLELDDFVEAYRLKVLSRDG